MAKRKHFAFLSLALACAMVLGTAPAPVAAVEETSENAELTIVREDTSLRREYEKHFLMSDGSYQAVVYDEPVHQLVDGAWEEIDNTLSLTADGYATAGGLTDVTFARNTSGNKLITLTQDGYTISWNVRTVSGDLSVMSATSQPLTAAQAEVMPLNLADIDAEEQKTLALKSTSTLQYANALGNGVDLKYTVLPSRVKEDIILRSPSDISAYVMNITAEGLTAQLLDNREVEFTDEAGEAVFTLHAPYMYDEAGELSQEIAVHLADRGNGNYVLTMTPDTQWLNDPARVYPVTVDPSVSTSTTRTNIIDNFVVKGQGNQDRNLDRLYIGQKFDSYCRAFIRFKTMPTIPSNATLTAATLFLTFTNGTSTAANASAYMVTGGSWESGTITWANMPSYTRIAYNISHNKVTGYQIPCLTAAKTWYNGSTTGQNANYGLMIRYYDESIEDYNAVYSADHTEDAKRPELIISYTTPSTIISNIVWPAPNHYTITSKWGYRIVKGESKVHRGIDISCSYIDVVSAIDGKVNKIRQFDTGGYGIEIIKPGTDFRIRYYHLKDGSEKVKVGDTVKAGDPIAISGNTGTTTGAHLHFQLQWGDKENSYNPLETYHSKDKRSAWKNPNPMFRLVDGVYVPNTNFDYTYIFSDYNDTSSVWAK